MAKKSKSTPWVDLTELKNLFTIKQIIDHYHIELKPSGKNHVGCCPIHKGTNPKSFSVDFEGNKWNCFGDCKDGGNHLDLVQMIEFGEKSGHNARHAGLKIQEWFGLSTRNVKETATEPLKEKTEAPTTTQDNETTTAETKNNTPLQFSFNHLKTDHPWFDERGIKLETIILFGLGLQEKGKTIPGRIAIPIHNEKNELIAYCGRAVTPEQIEEHGKYKQPTSFKKSLVVYNLNRQAPGQKTLIVVESFISVWWLWQAGIKNVICLMGSRLCEKQKELILNYFEGRKGGLILMFDNDIDGEKCTKETFFELGSTLFMKRIDFKEFGKKPHHIPLDKINSLFY